jgi:signal transduction histidine kinase
MHIQEIFNAIYVNHVYEYLVINRNLKIIEYSDKVFELCVHDSINCKNMHLTDAVPELYGLEEEIEKIFTGENTIFTLPYILKEHHQYVHIHIHPGREKEVHADKKYRYETIIILFENITHMAIAQQSLIQERNEKTLLLEELSFKNDQLKDFNEHMQSLVNREIKNNLEKQKLLELKSRHSQMGEMIGMITHQWKQPLNVINLIVNVLKINLQKKSLKQEEVEKKLDDILKQIKYMDQTVSDFQNFFNPFKEKIIFNLYGTIKTIIELVKYEYIHKNIALELHGNKKIMAYGYPNEFNQVIVSLLKNAKDAFMEKPHPKMQITITISEKEGAPQVTVEDNAGGIPKEIIENIFDLYMTTKQEGSGLGLNLAKNMIENNMQGEISVRNTERGALFSISLPPPPPLEN